MTFSMDKKILTGQTDEHIHWLSEKVGVHHDMHQAWLAMQEAAKLDGLNIEIASGYRNFDRQLVLWNNKYSGRTAVKNIDNQTLDLKTISDKEKIYAILLYSALPGASRHHWGSDIDVYATNLLPEQQSLQLEPWEYQQGGPFFQLSLWLNEQSKNFDFYFPYDKFRGGIATEPWHLSYAPLSDKFQQAFSAELLAEALQPSAILAKDIILENIDTIYTKYISNTGDFTLG
jgi:LAS superfamily LD-carboxypeptidase LdcB